MNELISFFFFVGDLAYIKSLLEKSTDEAERKRLSTLKEIFETRPKSYYQFRLVGVLVHSGNSESGHYYSFIKVFFV